MRKRRQRRQQVFEVPRVARIGAMVVSFDGYTENLWQVADLLPDNNHFLVSCGETNTCGHIRPEGSPGIGFRLASAGEITRMMNSRRREQQEQAERDDD